MLLEHDLNGKPLTRTDGEAQFAPDGIAYEEHGYPMLLLLKANLLLEDPDYFDLDLIVSGGHALALSPAARPGLLRFLAELALHPLQELGIGGGLAQAGQQQFGRLGRVQGIKHSP